MRLIFNKKSERIHIIQIFKSLLQTSFECLFAFTKPFSGIVILLTRNIVPFRISNLGLQIFSIFIHIIPDTFCKSKLQVGVDVHLDYTVADRLSYLFKRGSASSMEYKIDMIFAYTELLRNIDL